jgi:hypothetical protein
MWRFRRIAVASMNACWKTGEIAGSLMGYRGKRLSAASANTHQRWSPINRAYFSENEQTTTLKKKGDSDLLLATTLEGEFCCRAAVSLLG